MSQNFPQISWLQMSVLIIIHFHFHRIKISRFPFVWDILEVFAVTYLRFSESVFFALNLHFAIFARVLKEVSRKFWHRNKRMSPQILAMKIGLLGIIKVQQLFGWDEKEPVYRRPPSLPIFFWGRGDVCTQATKKPPKTSVVGYLSFSRRPKIDVLWTPWIAHECSST